MWILRLCVVRSNPALDYLSFDDAAVEGVAFLLVEQTELQRSQRGCRNTTEDMKHLKTHEKLHREQRKGSEAIRYKLALMTIVSLEASGFNILVALWFHLQLHKDHSHLHKAGLNDSMFGWLAWQR